jgi:hypothetical protein
MRQKSGHPESPSERLVKNSSRVRQEYGLPMDATQLQHLGVSH